MGSMNRVVLIGNLGGNAEIKSTRGGMQVARFSLATQYRHKVGDEWQEQTEWHKVSVLGKLAERLGQYLTKGKQVAVEGRLQTRSWDKDGQKHYMTEIIAHEIVLLGSKGDSRRSDEDSQPARQQAAPESQPYSDDDDIPF